jgi:vesicle coat complex subunit
MLIMTSIIRVGQSQFVTSPIDEDSYDRIMQDLHVVENIPNDRVMEQVYLNDTKAAFAKQVQAEDVSLLLQGYYEKSRTIPLTWPRSTETISR